MFVRVVNCCNFLQVHIHAFVIVGDINFLITVRRLCQIEKLVWQIQDIFLNKSCKTILVRKYFVLLHFAFFHICHSCCVWTRVLWQVARQRSDGDQLVVAGLGQLMMGVTFIPLFYGRAPLVVTEREVLALFCTPTP